MMYSKRAFVQSFVNVLIKTLLSGIKKENMSDQQLVEELHKPIIKKFKKKKYTQLLQTIFRSCWNVINK